MTTKFYMPILKSKAGEFSALTNLSEPHKKRIVPLFDITNVDYDHEEAKISKTIDEHLLGFCKKVIKYWPVNPMFIDTVLVNNEMVNGKSALQFVFELLAVKNITPMPVVYPNSSNKHLDTIVLLKMLYPIENIAIRLTVDHVYDPEFKNKIDKIISNLGISPVDCHLIFDLKDSDFSQTEDFADGIIDVIGDFPYFNEWLTVTIAGGAFPTISKIKASPQLVPRNDWKLYNILKTKISKTDFNRSLNFGDYSIVAPAFFEFNPKIMTTSANIRYTLTDYWYVVKGRALKKSIDWQQF